jgi:hypothetical protein
MSSLDSLALSLLWGGLKKRLEIGLPVLHDELLQDLLERVEALEKAATAQPAEVDQLTPKEVQAQECFTALRDEILNLNDGLEVNEVLHIIDNHTPEWV